MGCIYRIVSHVTGKSYVGQTAYSHPFERYKHHQASARGGAIGYLYDDMRKYDIREFECICICVVENEQLNALECYYAEQYNTYVWDGGYNIGECGKALVKDHLTDECRILIRRRAIWKNVLKSKKR
jgi:hypothetical protein